MFGRFFSSRTQFIFITLNYWAFTLTDGALRMLVLLHFHQLGYSAFALASLFLLYEFLGVITNFVGGRLAALWGLNRTMQLGTALQVAVLILLILPWVQTSMIWVMLIQAISGIAKDLNKMSAKTSAKFLVSGKDQQPLFRWIAFLTGSKNALKGVGFFLGGLLLSVVGFNQALLGMALVLALVGIACQLGLSPELGKALLATKQSKSFQWLSSNSAINFLSAARFFLFAARDLWFVIALPIYLTTQAHWSFEVIGAVLAMWVIGYGVVQSIAPQLIRNGGARAVLLWIILLCIFCLMFAGIFSIHSSVEILILGLIIFGLVFAVNSSLHSFWIVHLADSKAASKDVGFYYSANAGGRLLGTFFSGLIYQMAGMSGCLWATAVLVIFAVACSIPFVKQALLISPTPS